jgi:hypothetical protein
MSENTRIEMFLAKAREADEQAEKAKENSVRNAWRTIADGYRDLAHMKRRWS